MMKLRIKRMSIYRVQWTLFCFILIFAPPIVPYPHLILALFSLLLILTNYRTIYKTVLTDSFAIKWGLAMVAWLMYSLTIPMFVSLFVNDIVNTSNYTQTINRYGVLIFCIIPCSAAFLSFIKKHNLSFHFFVECIIWAGVLEAVCSILAFISPAIKSVFVYFMGRSGTYLYSNNWYITVRAYGFASTLVDLFGLGIALLAGLSYAYGVLYKRQYIFLSPIIAFSAVLNSRTGVLLYVLIVVSTTIYFVIKGKSKEVLLSGVSIALIIVISTFVLNILSQNQYTYSWLRSGITSVTDFFSDRRIDDNTSSLGLLFYKQNWDLPGGFRTIIGTGHSLYRADGYRHSDVGFINEIWVSGILGCLWLYWTQIAYYKRIIRGGNQLFKISSLASIICFFVFNIKGAALGYNPGAAVMLLIFIGFNYFSHVPN